jgi:type IV pilus assembly protein PilM
MTNQPGVWGIDLGQCALKALRLENVDGVLTATAFDYVEHPKILSQPDADPDQLTREALEKFLSRNTLRGDLVGISVPGQSGLARFVKLPPVEEKKIVDIVKFEAKQQIPFNLDEVVWDYQKIGSGVVTDGFAMETEIGLFAMKRDMVNRYLQHFQDVKVEVHLVQMAPLALCNYVSFDLLGKTGEPGEPVVGKKACVVALDIGADSSNLVITDGERIIWQRPIPLGGNHFTRALTKDMKLTFAKAEHLKRNATKSPDLKKILSSLKPVLNDFVGEVQRSLGYFTNTHRDAQVQYMIGLGSAFRLPGMQRFLQEKLGIEVRKLQNLERLSGDSVVKQPLFQENVLSFAVAYGLALQGLKLPKLQTNLLPQEIQIERIIRAKKPWAAVAAAALLLGTTCWTLSYYLEDRAVGATTVITAMKESKDVAGQVSAMENSVKTKENEVQEEIKAVKSIVAGQEERPNWISFNKFLGDVIPKPGLLEEGKFKSADPKKGEFTVKLSDGKDRTFSLAKEGAFPLNNLQWADFNKLKTGDPIQVAYQDANNLAFPEAISRYWIGQNQEGREAFRKMLEKQFSGRVGTADRDDSKSNLIHLNIEGFDCRYTDDLAAYWTVVSTKQGVKESVRPVSQAAKGPEGKGWVVELRGYTYHHNGRYFIIDSLVENIARKGIKDEPKTDTAPSPGAPVSMPNPIAGTPSAPGTAPGAAAPATTLPPADGAKPGEKKAWEPVINNISHVLVYRTDVDPKQGNDYVLINSSELAALFGTGSAGGGSAGGGLPGGGLPGGGRGAGGPAGAGMGMGGPAGAGGAGGDASGSLAGARSGWSPLGTPIGAVGGSGGGMGGYGSGRGPAGSSGGMGLPSGPGGYKPPDSGDTSETDKKKSGLTRTEFIVLFVWKEPTPSDKPPPETAAAPGAGLPGAPASPPPNAGSGTAPPPDAGGAGDLRIR